MQWRPSRSPYSRRSIALHSAPGRGSTFEVILPRTENDKVSCLEKAEAGPNGTERILFVDDEAAIVKMGDQMLKRLGYDVVANDPEMKALIDRYTKEYGEFNTEGCLWLS